MVYDRQGYPIGDMDWDRVVKSIAHRGESINAPENTAPAYILAARKGFKYVETDVAYTADGVPVCLHDPTIDRTSNGSGDISTLTLAQVRQYDFAAWTPEYGNWRSADFVGTKILTFEEFLDICRCMALHPYIELKPAGGYTQSLIDDLIAMVRAYGLQGKVSWISFVDTYLRYVANTDPNARLGYVIESITNAQITAAQALMTGTNDVFLSSSARSDTEVNRCIAANIPLETWTVDAENVIRGLNPYITGVTSNRTIAGRVLFEKYL